MTKAISVLEFRSYVMRKLPMYAAFSLVGSLGAAVFALFLSEYRSEFDLTYFESVFSQLIGPYWTSWELGLLDLLFLAVPLLFIGLLAIAVLAEAILWACKLDREDMSWSSFVWGLRSAPALLSWVLLLSVAPVSFYLFFGLEGLFWSKLVLVGLCLLLSQTVTLNAKSLTVARPGLLWRPAWPGRQAFSIVVSIMLLSYPLWWAEGFALDAINERSTTIFIVAMIVSFALSLLSVIPTSLCLFLWLNRTSYRDARLNIRSILSRRTLGALLAYELRMLVLMLPLAGGVVAVAMLLIFVVPQVQYSLTSAGRDFPPLLMLGIKVAGEWVPEYWWMVLGVASLWFESVICGRLYSELGLVRNHTAEPSGSRSSSHNPAQSFGSIE